jgi:N-ethylmaleimide reductase
MASLFDSIRLGTLTAANRIFMAPMTRSRAGRGDVPGENVATYYGQRAGAGLIISECVYPARSGKGYVRTPGIETAEQVKGWSHVTRAVHARGGKIFMQINHCGRISHPDLQANGETPIAPSAIRPAGQSWTDKGLQDFITPRAMKLDEIADVVAAYGKAAARAIEAGFDGVELHGASGYLAEQFLATGTNGRSDAYGGSVENRARFILEALRAMVAEAGGDRVGLKISPEMGFNDLQDANPVESFRYLVDQLKPLRLAYLHVALFGQPSTDYHGLLRPRFEGAYLIGGGLTQAKAEALLADGAADAAVFGASFIANPDLPERFRTGAPLTEPDTSTFYSEGDAGYTDYPVMVAG